MWVLAQSKAMQEFSVPTVFRKELCYVVIQLSVFSLDQLWAQRTELFLRS